MQKSKSPGRVMELIVITTLCISFLLLLTRCASLQIQLLPSNEQAHNEDKLFLSALPRKLRFITEEVSVKEQGGQDHTTPHNHDHDHVEVTSGKAYIKKEQVVKQGSRGTWKEWMEGTDTSQFYTMDYSHVRRRRPIHNKSLPVGP